MDCLLPITAAICLIQPSEITLRADFSRQVAGDVTHWSGGHNFGGGTLGHVGLELPLIAAPHFSINLGYVHESLLQTRSDRGEERVALAVVFRPFK